MKYVRHAILAVWLPALAFGQTQGADLIESLLKDAGVARGATVRGADVVSGGSRE
jgi:hypothetical protein